MSAVDNAAYWAGWYDSITTYGGDLLDLVMTCEGFDWYRQDIVMLRALNGS